MPLLLPYAAVYRLSPFTCLVEGCLTVGLANTNVAWLDDGSHLSISKMMIFETSVAPYALR